MSIGETWTGEVDTPTRRIGLDPDDIPADGEWYVMRSSEPVHPTDSPRSVRSRESDRIAQAVKYLRARRRAGRIPDTFDVAKVREETKEGLWIWHMLGRWRT